MTKVLDYIINHNKDFDGWTSYEKWEYREEVLDGMKEKLYYAGLFVAGGIALVTMMFLAGIFGN